MLSRRMAPAAAEKKAMEEAGDEVEARVARTQRRVPREPPSTFEQIMKSPVTRSVAREVTRGLLGALLGTPPRRRGGASSRSTAGRRHPCNGREGAGAETSSTSGGPGAGASRSGGDWSGSWWSSCTSCWVATRGRSPRSCRRNSRTHRPKPARQFSEKDQEMGEFVSVVLADTEDVWGERFRQMGRDYRGAETGPVHGPGRLGLRLRRSGRRPLLLPRRREPLHRPGLLRGHAAGAGRSG